MSSEARRKATALHEAAHAVVALLHPKARDPVRIELFENHRGETALDPSVDVTKLSEEEVFAEFITACAGNWAEVLLCADQVDMATFRAGDVQIAGKLGFDAGLEEAKVRELLEKADKQEAENRVRDNAEKIGKLAEALLEKGVLEGPEIRKIVLGEE